MSTTTDNRVIEPYLFFNGSCEQALEFYRKALGAEVQFMMRYEDSPELPQPGMVPPGFEKKIMHTSFRVGQTTVMASDGCSAEKASFQASSFRSRSPAKRRRTVRSPRWRTADRCGAPREDVLVPALRHGGGPFRHRLDDQRAGRGTGVKPSRRRRSHCCYPAGNATPSRPSSGSSPGHSSPSHDAPSSVRPTRPSRARIGRQECNR